MANMIPRLLDVEGVQPGEKKIYKILDQTLSDDYYVRYEPKIGNKFPDFVIFGPELGILILEIKDWSKSFIKSVDNKKVITSDGVERPNPLTQVNGYRNIISDESKKMFNQRYKYSINTIIVFVNMTRDDFDSIKDTSNNLHFTDLLKDTKMLFHEDLEEMSATNSSEDIISKFKSKMKHSKENIFTEKDANDIRLLLNPTIFIKDKVDQKFSILNEKQEAYSQKIPNDHKIIIGPAGSGKSIILQSQAKYVLSKVTEVKVLYICFNKVLLSDLRHTFINHDIDIYTIGKLPSDQTYDFIFVDEGQDLKLDSYNKLLDLLNKDTYGYITIACDGAQNLYDHNFLFSDISFDKSHIEVLGTNYRCSLQTHVYATEFLAQNNVENNDQVLSTMYMPETDRHYRLGSDPVVKYCIDQNDQYQYIREQVRYLLDNNCKERSIAVFFLTNVAVTEFMKQNDKKQGIQFNYIYTDKTEDNKDRYRPEDDKVLVTTYHSSKGLEFDHVFVVLPEKLQFESKFKKAIYVAMTRSIKQLYVVTNKESAYKSFADTTKERYDSVIIDKTSNYNNDKSLVLDYDIDHSFDVMKLAKDLNQYLGHQISDLNQLLAISTDDKRLNESYEIIEDLKQENEELKKSSKDLLSVIGHLKDDRTRQFNDTNEEISKLSSEYTDVKRKLENTTIKLLNKEEVNLSWNKINHELKAQCIESKKDLKKAIFINEKMRSNVETTSKQLESKKTAITNIEEELGQVLRKLSARKIVNVILIFLLIISATLAITSPFSKTDIIPEEAQYGPFRDDKSKFDSPIIIAQFEVDENNDDIPSCYITVKSNENVDGYTVVGSRYSIMKVGDDLRVYQMTKQDKDLDVAKAKEYERTSFNVTDKLVFTFSNPYIRFINLNGTEENKRVDEFIEKGKNGYVISYDFDLKEMVYIEIKKEGN